MHSYLLKNPTAEKMTRSVGGAASMSPTGVAALMFTLSDPGDEVRAHGLEYDRLPDGTCFMEAFTAGEVVGGSLVCAMPLADGGGYVSKLLRVGAIRGEVMVSSGLPCTLSAQRFEGRLRRELRRVARRERGEGRQVA